MEPNEAAQIGSSSGRQHYGEHSRLDECGVCLKENYPPESTSRHFLRSSAHHLSVARYHSEY